ncbi:MAG: hypothetical protein N2C14_23435 [Planctomycetales bacterium]
MLEYLEDQLDKEQPNRELLKYKPMYDKFKRLRDQAGAAGPQGAEARRKLEKHLRGLGLTPNTTLRGSRDGDSFGGAHADFRLPPPSKYKSQADAYSDSLRETR